MILVRIIIRIRTPKGQARSTAFQLKPFIIKGRKVKHQTYVSKDNDTIIWICEGDPKHIIKISQNVVKFDALVKMMFKTKAVKWLIKKHLKPEDKVKLKKMFDDKTTVDIIKDGLDITGYVLVSSSK